MALHGQYGQSPDGPNLSQSSDIRVARDIRVATPPARSSSGPAFYSES
jgi:hypothetical protein